MRDNVFRSHAHHRPRGVPKTPRSHTHQQDPRLDNLPPNHPHEPAQHHAPDLAPARRARNMGTARAGSADVSAHHKHLQHGCDNGAEGSAVQ
ncbi:hypothetical protein V493_07895 [Pseudogymnoascus sp. VKM F-4281 (FW-2241)]|nr:hypothetical protein V493_07895 [Pseudogymnoascus sp. VKM F-4281 (FW-2241)]